MVGIEHNEVLQKYNFKSRNFLFGPNNLLFINLQLNRVACLL